MQCRVPVPFRYPDGVISGGRCPNEAVKLDLCQAHLDGEIEHETRKKTEAENRLAEIAAAETQVVPK
jgi:hypothetical protein